MKKIFLCLDGTWNSAYQKGKRDDGIQVLKPSNVLKLARAVVPTPKKGFEQVVYYDTGVGSMSKHPGFANKALSKIDNVLGGAWGAGFEANVEDALTFLIHNYNTKKGNSPADQVFVFGFSRGAATARALTQFISWMEGLPTKKDAYFLPKLFRIYVDAKGKTTMDNAKAQINAEIDLVNVERKKKGISEIDYPFSDWQKIRINFLGVWDTVLALGGRLVTMASRKFYLSSQPADCVDHAVQALAIDEQRYDFLPEVWESPSFDGQVLVQNWFAGVHSNIGGGYVDDGLANITLHWMINRVEEYFKDVKFDDTFLRFYWPFPEDDLVDSKSKTYKVKDFVMRKNGVRKIVTELDPGFEKSGLRVHRTVKERMEAEYHKYEHMNGLYEPKNLISYIRKVGEDNVFS